MSTRIFTTAFAALLSILAFSLAPASASAAPAWGLEAFAADHVKPNQQFRYWVYLRNIGDEATEPGATLEIELPDGLESVSLSGASFPWTCDDPTADQTIECELAWAVTPGQRPELFGFGEFPPLILTVNATDSGTQAAKFTMSGGNASADEKILPTEITQPHFEVMDWSGHIPPDAKGKLQAGSHPRDIVTVFRESVREFAPEEGGPRLVPVGAIRNLTADLPAGFVGSPASAPICELDDLAPGDYSPFGGSGTEGDNGTEAVPSCPVNSIVGAITIRYTELGGGAGNTKYHAPIFNMRPPAGEPARFGFNVAGYINELSANARTDGDLGAYLKIENANQGLGVIEAVTTFWGVPGDPSHDLQRCQTFGPPDPLGNSKDHCPGTPGDVVQGPNSAGGGAINKPFLTLPTSCSEPGQGLRFDLSVDSWDQPIESDQASFTTTANPDGSGPALGTTGCDRVPFQPRIEVQPTTDEAETPTGLEVALTIPPDGINNPNGISQSHLKDATVTLPDGMTANPSQANGLAVCSASQIGLTSGDSNVIRFNKAQPSCPDASQLGEVRIDTPLLNEPLFGSVHIASQGDLSAPGAENPFNSTLALYIVAEGQGILIKLAGEVAPDPETGQLVTRFLNNPQQPFERFALKFKGGQRAPLSMPPTCGVHTTTAELSPWSRPNQPVTVIDTFHITKGPNGGPCPSGGIPPFRPNFTAGTINNNAGSYSPFLMRLTRQDGEQDMTKFGSILPPGVVGNLSGVAKCSEAQIASARSRGDSGEGRAEIASPSCPDSSQIGRIEAGAGVGSIQTYVGGKIYLAGPYKGAPLSVVVITPAVAGPFDVGSVVVRIALDLDPKTAEVEVDGNSSDPIPHILAGIPLRLRDLRVHVDREDFILNPTSCEPSSTRATLFGSFLNILDPSDDAPIALSDRFQAANCASLGFKPKLSLTLTGGTKRGGHPGLKAVYTPRPGDANVENVVVRLPRSAFLEQAHIRTICTRVQFAADNCPPAAQYGYIRAFTPLLDEPLQGPVWLRSSNNKLPDLVFDLKGIVDVEVSTRIDSVRGGIRANVETAPDAPLSKVVLTMQGGKKGLIVNSTNLCRGKNRAEVSLSGHNGKDFDAKPVVKPAGCQGKRNAKRRAR